MIAIKVVMDLNMRYELLYVVNEEFAEVTVFTLQKVTTNILVCT